MTTQLPSKREAFRLIKKLERIRYEHSPKLQALFELERKYQDRFEASPVMKRLKEKIDKEHQMERIRRDRLNRALRNITNEILATGINAMTCRKLLKLHRAVHGIVDTRSCVAETTVWPEAIADRREARAKRF